MTLRLACALALYSAATPWQTTARAQSGDVPGAAPRPVALDTACAAITGDKLLELVALELAPRPVRAATGNDSGGTMAHVVCLDTQAQLSVHDQTRGRQQALALDLSETLPAARTRLVALALSELIATVEMEPAGAPSPAHVRSEEATARTPPAPLQLRGWLALAVTREGSPRVLAPALQLGALTSFGPWPLALQAELQANRAGRALADGELTSTGFSGAVALLGLLRTSQLDFTLGGGVRLGYTLLEGDANDASLDGRSVAGRWWGPSVSASALLRLVGPWALRGALDGTYLTRGLRATDASGAILYELEGGLMSASLGLSLRML